MTTLKSKPVSKASEARQKTASKSEAKRVRLQKGAKNARTQAETTAKAPKEDEVTVIEGLQEQICDANARITILEANQAILIDSFAFAANECRPIYGLGGIAVIFDAVARKFKK